MRRAVAALLAVLVLAAPAVAQQGALEEAVRQRPNEAILWYHLAWARCNAGDVAGTSAALERASALGDGFLPPRAEFACAWSDPAFQAIRGKMEAKLPRLDSAPTAFEIEDRALVPEGIAYDAHSKAFFVGSIAQRRILKVGPENAVSEFAGAAAKLDAILGLAVDGPRRTLYAVSTSALLAEGRKQPRNAIVAFDVDNGRLLRRVEVPAAKQLNDVAIARGGRIFTSDSASGAVYEIPPQGSVRELVPPGALRGTNGLAASPDGKRLYLAHSTGLAVVEVAGGPVRRLENATRETVASIDGLYEWQGQLIGVQNATTPGRVIVVTLSADGNTVTKVQTLLSHHHNALDEPTTGVVTERGFFLLAATGVARYGDDGRIRDADTAPTPTVLRIPLPR